MSRLDTQQREDGVLEGRYLETVAIVGFVQLSSSRSLTRHLVIVGLTLV